ncbi:MAG: hypothetical protein O2931_07655 [Planctomycetota bacterium]|nr:hypothetical protein [Planctomycetota bacterium]MDA1178656.1 hypothetical protein [Planctomycetota bacterium]
MTDATKGMAVRIFETTGRTGLFVRVSDGTLARLAEVLAESMAGALASEEGRNLKTDG